MNLLDENIREDQRQLLQSWRFSIHQIGYDISRKGIKDDEIITLLHQLTRPTFFTRDWAFCKPRLSHAKYCLVYLNVDKKDVADYIRRFLRHKEFNTYAKRLGTVIRVSSIGVTVWRLNSENEQEYSWE